MAQKGFDIFKLKNGVEIILVPSSDSPATTVMATVMVGSKYEDNNISGLSHFLEHMAFKGTNKRPRAIDISTELEEVGASFNASTGQEETSYYAKVRNKHFPMALDIISDIYLNSTIPPEEIIKEKGVIIEEINMYEDAPMYSINDLFLETLYGDQPAGRPVIGRKEVVERINRKDIIEFRNKHYKSGNTIVTISGGYNEDGVREKLESTFGVMDKNPETKMPKVQKNKTEPRERIKFKDSDQSHLLLGFKAFPAGDERKPALAVLSNILGTGKSSRLFVEIREKRGLAYYVGSWMSLSSNSGFIAARSGVNKDKVEDVIRIIINEFKRLKNESVTDEELIKSKENMIGKMFLSLETSDSVGDFYTDQRVLGLDPETPEEIANRINKVSSEDIMSVANDLFTEGNLHLSIIGPFKNQSFGDILKI